MDLRQANLAWSWLGHILMCALAAWALFRGKFTERTATSIVGLGWIITPLMQSKGVVGLDLGTTSVDLIVFILLTWLSCRTRKLWVLFAASSILLGVAGHFSAVLMNDISLPAYISNNGFWSGYMLLFALFIGLVDAERTRLST